MSIRVKRPQSTTIPVSRSLAKRIEADINRNAGLSLRYRNEDYAPKSIFQLAGQSFANCICGAVVLLSDCRVYRKDVAHLPTL